jgi:hypothetical protein
VRVVPKPLRPKGLQVRCKQCSTLLWGGEFCDNTCKDLYEEDLQKKALVRVFSPPIPSLELPPLKKTR